MHGSGGGGRSKGGDFSSSLDLLRLRFSINVGATTDIIRQSTEPGHFKAPPLVPTFGVGVASLDANPRGGGDS